MLYLCYEFELDTEPTMRNSYFKIVSITLLTANNYGAIDFMHTTKLLVLFSLGSKKTLIVSLD